MIKEYSKKGISLVVLLVTIAVLIILLSVIVVSIDGVVTNSRLSSFATDLSIVEDLTNTFYMQNNEFPVSEEQKEPLSQREILSKVDSNNKEKFIEELKLNNDYNEQNDNLGIYYVIDLSKLDIDHSTRGTLENGENSDVYIVSYPSMNAYYLKGIKAKGSVYFSLSSKLTNIVKIEKNVAEKSDNNVTIQSIQGIRVKKITKGWTNNMGIYVSANLESDEELYLEAESVGKKKLVTNDGLNEFSFNDLSELNGFSSEESNAFKNVPQDKKKLIFTKQKFSQEVGKIEVDLSNYETEEPTWQIDPREIVHSEEYNMIPFKVTDSISGVQEVRYEYLTKYDKKGIVQNYYTNVLQYDITYLKARGKKALPDKDGNIALKVNKDVEGIQVLVIDRAGNVNTNLFTIGLYENNDIYIGLDLKENTNELLSYNVVLSSEYGISKLDIQTSNDGLSYSDIQTINVNSYDTTKIVDNSHENLGKVSYLKVTATDNSTNTSTRIFKLDEKDTLELGQIVDRNTTFNLKEEGTYYNPIIPKGFAPINEGNAKWGTADGWTKGLVIQDEKGNEFVWVPVKSDEEYAKDFSFPSDCGANESNTTDDTLPSGITDENADVVKYGGFYIGRYEAGIPEGDNTPSNKTGVPVSKRGITAWTNIDYTNTKESAESMISTDYVQSGLLTGKAWDTTCHWIEDSVLSLTDSRTYGNYNNSVSPANVKGYGNKELVGFSEYWKVKNIYDLAGNVWEITNEMIGSEYICRGGGDGNGNYYSVSFRGSDAISYSNYDLGFRIRLYIK